MASNGSLILTSSGSSDTGYYHCKATNAVGTTNDSSFALFYNSSAVSKLEMLINPILDRGEEIF